MRTLPDKNNFENVILAIVFSVLLLQVFRNLTSLYFLAYAAGTAVMVLLIVTKLHKAKISNVVLLGLIPYLGILITASYATYINANSYQESPLIGLQRFIFCYFIIAYIVAYKYDIDFIRLYRVYLVIGVLAALSIFYQHFFGELQFLADPGGRAGLVRFTSLLGSLTVFGTVVGAFIFLTFYLSKSIVLQFVLISIFFASSILSLQKAAIASMFIGFAAAVLLNILSLKKALLLLILLLVSASIIITSALSEEYRLGLQSFIWNMFGIEGKVVTDVTFAESLVDRFTELPKEAIDYWSLSSLFLGVGVYGASGGLGYSLVPMAHNLFVEIIIMWGLFGVIISAVILYYLLVSVTLLLKKTVSQANKLGAGMYITLVTPSIFAGSALLFHPALVIALTASVILLNQGGNQFFQNPK